MTRLLDEHSPEGEAVAAFEWMIGGTAAVDAIDRSYDTDRGHRVIVRYVRVSSIYDVDKQRVESYRALLMRAIGRLPLDDQFRVLEGVMEDAGEKAKIVWRGLQGSDPGSG